MNSIKIKQIDNARQYEVYFNEKMVGCIDNEPRYHNDFVDTLLFTNARNLVQSCGLRLDSFKTKFVGEIKHVLNT